MASDFFEQQDIARKQTGRLVSLFVVAVILIIATVYVAVTLIFVASHKGQVAQVNQVVDLGRLTAVSAIVLTVILSGSLYKIAALSSGGGSVARLMGGEEIDPATTDLAERRLLNVVEEMALASGTPVPTVYVLNNERSINAFAAGFDTGSAVIAVSRGCLDYLTRDELQGVIGHEFSHILNGDMKLNLRLIGVLHGILLIGLIGYTIIRWGSTGSRSSRSSDDKKDSGTQIFLLGLALLIIGYVGVFFGRLIKAGISRQREFLADASSVQFTRNPDGIAGALKKIGGLAEGSKIESPNAEQACHMFFGQGVSAWMELLATHPPLVARIKRIDPRFDGVFPEVKLLNQIEASEPPEKPKRQGPLPPFLQRSVATAILADSGARARPAAPEFAIDSAASVASIGAPTGEHVAYASALLSSLPEQVAAAAREPFTARAVVYALLIDLGDAVRQVQLRHLGANDAQGTVAAVVSLLPTIEQLGPAARIPLVDLALPALRLLSPGQYQRFRANVDALVSADQQTSLFEYALQRMLLRHLDQHFGRRAPARATINSMAPVLGDVGVVLSALATRGNDHDGEMTRAFAQGVSRLGPEGASLRRASREASSLASLDAALDRLAWGSPAVKKRVLDASAACIAADGRVTVDEGELLRAIADALDCPMPPLLNAQLPGGNPISKGSPDNPTPVGSL